MITKQTLKDESKCIRVTETFLFVEPCCHWPAGITFVMKQLDKNAESHCDPLISDGNYRTKKDV